VFFNAGYRQLLTLIHGKEDFSGKEFKTVTMATYAEIDKIVIIYYPQLQLRKHWAHIIYTTAIVDDQRLTTDGYNKYRLPPFIIQQKDGLLVGKILPRLQN